MSHQKKHDFLPFRRFWQKTVENSLKHYRGRTYQGGPETLDPGTINKAPLWIADHGQIKQEES